MGERRRGNRGWQGPLAAVLLMGASDRGEAEEAGPPTVPEEEVGEPELPLDEEEEPRVRAFGRVFARVSADERDEYVRALSIPSARVGVAASLPHLKAEVSADLSAREPLRDAYVRLADGDKRLLLYGGQFRSPFLARSLESRWELPLMQRGLVEDYLTETQRMGGRRLGLMGEVRLKEAWNLTVSGGLFQGAKDEELGTRTGEDAALRVRARPMKGLTVGASTWLSEVFDGTRRHAVAADATLRWKGLAVSGEYVTGRLSTGPFTAQLGLASFTLPIGETEWALQPVAGAEVLQLHGTVLARGYSLVGGLNLLLSDHFKAQLHAERALRAGDEAAGFEYSLQLATRF